MQYLTHEYTQITYISLLQNPHLSPPLLLISVPQENYYPPQSSWAQLRASESSEVFTSTLLSYCTDCALTVFMTVHVNPCVSICMFKAWIKGKLSHLFTFILFWTYDFLTNWALFQNILFCFPQRKGSVQVWNNMRVVNDDKWWWLNYDQQG